MAQYVIIGNGIAATGCIEGIRSIDRDNKIVVISEEKHPVYCRPLISYYLEGKTDLANMNYRGDDFYDAFNCSVVYGEKAAAVNADKKEITLASGEKIPYCKLCIAAGSSPFTPPFAGMETVKDKFSFLTIDDMLSLERAVSRDTKVLIIGAGLIGLKCAEGLKEKVASITVCDLAGSVLSSILDKESAQIVQSHLEHNGIKFLLSDSVSEFKGNKAIMSSGNEVDFDVLVTAVGVKANVDLIKEAGGKTNRGIITDKRMCTTVADVYAAGDCTEGTDVSSGTRKVLALLPNAYMQGKCAGINMAGGKDVFDKAIPMNSIGFFGLHLMTAGSYFGSEDGGEVYEEKTSPASLKKLFIKDNRLTGFILVGGTDRAGIYTSLIREKVPLSDINFDVLKKSPTTFAFPAERRRKMFGGVV